MKKIFLLSVLSFVFCAVFAQKRFSILGDSYSTFKGYVTPEKNLCFYRPVSKFPNNVHDVKETWWWIVKEDLGYELDINNSYSGATVCNTGYAKNDYTDRSFVTRMKELGSPDILFVFGGTNDCWAKAPIGEFQYEKWTKADLYKFRPAFAYMLNYLKEHHPQARILNICNSELDGEYGSSMAEICKHYEVENILLENIDKQHEHPSIEGMKEIARQVEKQLKTLPSDSSSEKGDTLNSNVYPSDSLCLGSTSTKNNILIFTLLFGGVVITVVCSHLFGLYSMRLRNETKAKRWATLGIVSGVLFYIVLVLLVYFLYKTVWNDIYEVFFQ